MRLRKRIGAALLIGIGFQVHRSERSAFNILRALRSCDRIAFLRFG